MSVAIETIVACDGCGDNWNADDRYMSAKDIRAGRKMHGWTQRGSEDYCEVCSQANRAKKHRGRSNPSDQ